MRNTKNFKVQANVEGQKKKFSFTDFDNLNERDEIEDLGNTMPMQ